MTGNTKPPDDGLPRASISIGCSEPALEALARSSWSDMPPSVKTGEHDDQLLFNVSVSTTNNDIDTEKLERLIAWSWENRKSARIRHSVRKARENMKYLQEDPPGVPDSGGET